MSAPAQPDASLAWRGVAAESVESVTGGLAVFLRARSRRLLGSLLSPHRRAIAILGFAIVGQNAAAMAGPYLVEKGIDRGIPSVLHHGDAAPLALIAGAFLLASAAQGALTMLFLRLTGRVGQEILYDLRIRLFRHFQRLSIAFHERYTSGRVVSRMTSDVDAIADLLATGLENLVFAGLSVISTGIVLVVMDARLAAVALATFPLLAALSVWFRRASERAYRAVREAVAMVIVQFAETFAGIRAVQAFRREPRNQAIFCDLNAGYMRAYARSARLGALFGPGVQALGAASVAITLAVGAYQVIGGTATIGVLAAFILYLRRFFEPMQDLTQFFSLFQSATAALEKLSGVLEEEPSVPEPDDPLALPPAGPGAGPQAARGALTLGQVRFGYRSTRVLHGIDLDIPAGQTVALLGPTGAGKSTIARLVARFYDPDEGDITLDGVPLARLAEAELRRAVVMVTQEPFLFAGSVADNILLGRPEATADEIAGAAAAIGAHGFIERLPEGYGTDVSKRGGRLSAGQRQLVAFARAFIADPRVLVLDEATSSLDLPSERLVQHALRTLLASRTAIIIAHRLSTVEIAERVLVVDGGRIVEDGPPSELMGEASHYRALHEAWQASIA